jgi:Xaa-Pro aminopeptidase
MDERSLRVGSPLELWVELIREGEERARMQLDEQVESYLVFLLQRHQCDALLAGRSFALEWLDGMERVGSERAEVLRDVGDRCLIVAGLYPRLAHLRRVTPAYYASIGQAAYAGVADATRAAYAELFRQLARAFEAMQQVLRRVGPRPELRLVLPPG